METLLKSKAYGGYQAVFSHAARSTDCEMTFAVYLPPQRQTKKMPVLWYLSGLTCTHANVMEKGEYRRLAAEHGIIVVVPDTSPRGELVPDEPNDWQFGSGAGFYVDATESPYSHHYKMYSYVAEELPALIADKFPADMDRQGIFGHSMGGHGALVLALRNPGRFRSCSAFAPIVEPGTAEFSRASFERYLGPDPKRWRAYEATKLIEDGHHFPEILVDQGGDDNFLDGSLRPWLLGRACASTTIKLKLNMREGYDHSYYFVSTFMDDHMTWHADRLTNN